MKCFYSFLLLIFYFPTFAQIQDIIENDSITWVAEWEADYLLDDFDASDSILNNRIYLIKYLSQDEFELQSTKRFFSYLLWEAVRNNQIKTFSDKDCTKTLANEAALYTDYYRLWFNNDTLIDPIVYDTRFDSQMHLNYQEVMQYRVRQFIYYNISKSQFQMQVLAIAPLIKKHLNDTNDLYSLEPLFWFKPEMGKPSIYSESITWAQGLTTKENRLVFSKAKIYKNTMADTLVNHFLYSFEKRLDIPFFQINEENKFVKIDSQERWEILNPIDSIDTNQSTEPTFDSKKYLKIVQYHYTSEDCKALRMHQEWFWDNRQNKLFIYLKTTSLLVPSTDEHGNFLGYKSLFYRKTED
jgi:Gliding motility associated protein GldN